MLLSSMPQSVLSVLAAGGAKSGSPRAKRKASRCRLKGPTDAEVKSIAAVLKQNDSIEELELIDGSISTSGILSLTEALAGTLHMGDGAPWPS